MKLSVEQINLIKAFVSRRGFTYPDVQLEIIDHVASRVEQLITDNPKLSLEEAINITHGEFGEMGFSVFEDSMISSLQKKYFKLFYTIFFSFFKWQYLPAMGITVYLIQKIYIIVNQPKMFVIVGCGALLMALLFNSIWFNLKHKKYNKLLTMKMGNVYLLIFSVMYNVWNIFGVQLQSYRYLNIQFAAVVYAALMMLVTLLYITVNKLRHQSVNDCKDLDERYHILNA